MSSSRVRTVVSVGSVCIILLFLLLPQANPDPVSAAWNPDIANGKPKDPGTPFEEPEGGTPGNTNGEASRGALVGGGQQAVSTASVASGAAKIVVRQLVLRRLILVLWHLQ